MSVKKEASGRRSIQVEVEVPGTPEEVWQAIATGPGVSSWFVPTEIEAREGGTVTAHFGAGMDSVATVTAWEPPRRFAATSADLGPEAPAIATEWQVEARDGGVCVVRVVHSLFAETDDWDDQLSGLETGWPAFFRILLMYLKHFRGMPVASFRLVGFGPEPESAAWEALTRELGIVGVGEGERWESPEGMPPLTGVVEEVKEGVHPYRLVRLSEPTTGAFFLGAHGESGPIYLGASVYLYGDQAATSAAQTEAPWQAWMQEHFPIPEGAPSC